MTELNFDFSVEEKKIWNKDHVLTPTFLAFIILLVLLMGCVIGVCLDVFACTERIIWNDSGDLCKSAWEELQDTLKEEAEDIVGPGWSGRCWVVSEESHFTNVGSNSPTFFPGQKDDGHWHGINNLLLFSSNNRKIVAIACKGQM